jgi:hypothetical protein
MASCVCVDPRCPYARGIGGQGSHPAHDVLAAMGQGSPAAPLHTGLAGYTTVKTFVATRHEAREQLGETLTEWLVQHPQLEVVAQQVLQSSDSTHHCTTIVLFLKETST